MFPVAGFDRDEEVVEEVVQVTERRSLLGLSVPALADGVVQTVRAVETLVWSRHAVASLHTLQHLATSHA